MMVIIMCPYGCNLTKHGNTSPAPPLRETTQGSGPSCQSRTGRAAGDSGEADKNLFGRGRATAVQVINTRVDLKVGPYNDPAATRPDASLCRRRRLIGPRVLENEQPPVLVVQIDIASRIDEHVF